jgi:catechol 2,3-dioxygenase-like lactoylglutathione lyase family enzyme
MPEERGIRTKGILHFTISVRDHERAAEYYADLLGCEIERISSHFAFMRCGDDRFVLARMPNHASPNPPGGTWFHHAFIVDPPEFDHAMAVIKARRIEILKHEDAGHRSFPGRHVYFHDPDGNGVEIYTTLESDS